MASDDSVSLRVTPLFSLCQELGARFTPFAGYRMALSFPAGTLREHQHTREAASLFDVSHMGQIVVSGPDRVALLESLTPASIRALPPGRLRYSMFTTPTGGVLDDLMIACRGDDLMVVVNAARREADLAHLREAARGHAADVALLEDQALLALQGPAAAAVLSALAAGVGDLPFLGMGPFALDGVLCWVSRSGYTGEDGFEISVKATHVEPLARRLLADPRVAPAGLAARDTLRLEAGLCLNGADLTPSITPVEAGLGWVVGRERRLDGQFPGSDVLFQQLAEGPAWCRVGLRLAGRAVARPGAPVLDPQGAEVGVVTSGGFSPTLNQPIAMARVPAALASPGQPLAVRVRDHQLDALVTALPFVPARTVGRACSGPSEPRNKP
ncbi:glycine cleavage system aminomethyltransferase GcvT [Pararhodospirillum oryzae]|uniref:aminomethyltransferase n=1 Tax=Pararhodospirillum oryzae TaxID=478448 RepID=A0A512H6D5_9PROT|nr:glycine cleavage system aminomethyltransferase GcvT [Pararhodospirillum oryzae]GEO81013.1 aminomethyltransferase [Pararhodospirillum oryzae]